MFWGSAPEDLAQQANVNGSHSAILLALREHVQRSWRSRWDHVSNKRSNERSNPDRRSLFKWDRRIMAEVVFFALWVAHVSLLWAVGYLPCIHFELCKLEQNSCILNSCAGNYLVRRKHLVRPLIQSWLDGFEPHYVMPFWCFLFTERCCKVAWSRVFLWRFKTTNLMRQLYISRQCLGCRKLGPGYPGSTTAPRQTSQRFW